MALNVDLEPGVTLRIGEVAVRFVAKTGRKARLEITAARDIPIVKETMNVNPAQEGSDTPTGGVEPWRKPS